MPERGVCHNLVNHHLAPGPPWRPQRVKHLLVSAQAASPRQPIATSSTHPYITGVPSYRHFRAHEQLIVLQHCRHHPISLCHCARWQRTCAGFPEHRGKRQQMYQAELSDKAAPARLPPALRRPPTRMSNPKHTAPGGWRALLNIRSTPRRRPPCRRPCCRRPASPAGALWPAR